MGCGTSSQLPKRETRAQSQVTVAAQQRAEAAYRRQRMAQEREQTAVLRAEMEVERARMLKEMTCGSRRPSYCLELENLKEEAPDDVRKNLEECLKDYSTTEEKNARNSLPDKYPKSAVIMRSESRDETGANQNTEHQSQESDENENLERRSSTEQNSDKDLCLNVEQQPSLPTGKIGSPQAFPGSVRIEENKQTRGYSGDEKPRRRSGMEQILALKGNKEKTIEETSQEIDGPQKRKRNEEASIVQDSETNQNQTFGKRVVDSKDVTAITRDDSVAVSGENSTAQDDSVKVTSPNGPVPIGETTSDVNYASSDTHPVAVTENVNEEQTRLETKDKNDEGEHHQHLNEKSDNAANGTEPSQTVIKGSKGQDPEKIESSLANIALSENEDGNVGTENDKNEQFDQLREITRQGK